MSNKPTYEELLKKNQGLEERIDIYRSFVDKSQDLFYRTDLEGRIIFISSSVYGLSGYTVEEAIGMNMAEKVYLFPEERRAFLSKLEKDGQVSNFGAQLKRKDGSVWWASTNAYFYKDHEGNILGVEGLTRDITDLKHTETAFRTSEERFKIAFHTSPDSINLNRVSDGMYIEINQGFTDLTGYSREEVIGKTSIEINVWKNPKDREQLIKGLMQKGEVKDLEAQFIRKNGDVCMGIMSARTLKINDEDIILSITRDITDKKVDEKQLLRFATVIEQANEEVLITDIEGVIQYINPSLEKNFGYSKHELIGQKPSILKSKVHDSSFYEELWKTILNKKIWKGLIHNQSKNGRAILHDTQITPILDSRQNISAFVSIRRDITEQKKMEQHLLQSQKLEAIGTLAGGVAHDFNNILGAILGYSELALLDVKEDDPVKYPIDQILKAGHRAKELVRQILLFSHQTKQEMIPVKVTILAKEVINLLRATLPSTIEIKKSFSKESGLVLSEPGQIHQVLMNLCTNAVHAMGDEGGILKVIIAEIEISKDSTTILPKLEPGTYYKIEISDTGCGIPVDIQEKIFDPFFTTKPRGKGTGMGLSVVHGILESHGGAINVYSEPGKGTTFNVFLPIMESEEPGEIKSKAATPKGKEHILFVDDEPALVELGEKILTRLGYKVTAVSDSLEALEEYQKNPDRFDLVITDKDMPGMTGIGLSKKIISIEPDQPIIMCTGFSEAITKKEADAIGIRELLHKPIILKEIGLAIRRVLDSANI